MEHDLPTGALTSVTARAAAPVSYEVMRQTMLRCAAAVLVATASPLMAQRAPVGPATRSYVKVDTNVLALTNVRVIDGTGAAARERQTIIGAMGGLQRSVPPAVSRSPPARRSWISPAKA